MLPLKMTSVGLFRTLQIYHSRNRMSYFALFSLESRSLKQLSRLTKGSKKKKLKTCKNFNGFKINFIATLTNLLTSWSKQVKVRLTKFIFNLIAIWSAIEATARLDQKKACLFRDFKSKKMGSIKTKPKIETIELEVDPHDIHRVINTEGIILNSQSILIRWSKWNWSWAPRNGQDFWLQKET